MELLTDKELALYTFLCDTNNWRAPSYKTMARALGHESDGYVGHALKRLHAKGYISAKHKPLKHSENNAS